jgi:serine/threonine protein kinase
MSTVYRARQLNMDRDIALKVVSAELAGDPQFISRFEREARVIASLEHPRILPVHDYGHQGDYFYMVMRLVEGESLRERLMREPLSPEASGKLLDQIASALDYAHSKGVIHRDLKPNNIMIDEQDNIYLMDFGIAKLVAASQQFTQTGMIMGTPAYMAPEQWRGENVDARTDVYALGVIIYEMLTGRPPFESDTPFTLMYKHLNDRPVTLREFVPDLPEQMEQVVFKAMAKDPAERYPSAGDLAAAYADALNNVSIPVAASVPSAFESPRQSAPQSGMPPLPLPPEGMPDVRKPKEVCMTGGEDLPPGVRNMIDWAHQKMENVSIPGFVAPSAAEAVQLEAEPGTGGPWYMPANAPAFNLFAPVLGPQEPLIGVLYLRGTAEWRHWKQVLIAILALLLIGGIVPPLKCLNVLGILGMLYVAYNGYRIWHGQRGHYYLGFTPARAVIVPITPDGVPLYDRWDHATWEAISRLRMTDEYIWLEARGSDGLHLLASIPAMAGAGLGRQRKWLPQSPIAQLLRERGYTIR